MKTITLTKGHYTQPDNYEVENTLTLHVPNGWQHIYSNTHYRLSHNQTKKVKLALSQGYQLPYNITLWEVDDPKKGECPHCRGGHFIAGIGN